MKEGEIEAKLILEKYGIIFDDTYYDDNKKNSMPDLKYKDGRFLEITHTLHNNAIFYITNHFHKMPIDKQLAKMEQSSNAYKRIRKLDYEKNNYELSELGKKQFADDLKLVKEHIGYDPLSLRSPHSEFKCDIPSLEFSVENILREVTSDKGKKYPNENVDLFIFVVEDEFDLLLELFGEYKWNGYANTCIKEIINSPFPFIYICVWDIYNQKYETENPRIVKIINRKKEGIQVERM